MKQQDNFENYKKKIFIVDDHAIVRLGLRCLINQEKDLWVCGEADNANDALKAVKESKPDIMIIDVSLKGQNGIELIKDIKLRYHNLPIIAYSIHDESIYAERVLRAGARGYIMKNEACDKIIDGLYQVLNGGIFVSNKVTSKIMNKFIYKKADKMDSPIELLTDRELEVFRLIGQGYGTRQIAKELFLGVKTIETHRAHIKNKLNLKNSTALIQYAIKWEQSAIFT